MTLPEQYEMVWKVYESIRDRTGRLNIHRGPAKVKETDMQETITILLESIIFHAPKR